MGTVRQRNWGFVRGMRGVAAGISTATRCSWKKRMTKWREKVEAAESAHKSGHEQAASINSIKKREREREKKNVAQPRIRNFQLFFLHDDSKTALFKPYRIRWPRLYSSAPPSFYPWRNLIRIGIGVGEIPNFRSVSEAKDRINARKKFGKDLSALLLLLIFFKVVV